MTEHDERMAAELEAGITRLLLADARQDCDVLRQVAVLTLLMAKMLCALADADGREDELLLASQAVGLRAAVLEIRAREPRRRPGAAPAWTH